MKKKLLFIFNPNSGKGKIKNMLYNVVDIFTKEGFDVTVYPTQSLSDCTERIQDCDGFDLIAVSGGDGTLNEAVSGMLMVEKEKRVPIGYIPSGTMNDFASSNNIPKTIEEAAASLVRNDAVTYDIGTFNDDSFIYVAAFGAFTEVSYDTSQISKNLLGAAAYFFEGVKKLPKIEGIRTRIETAEGEIIDENILLCLIMNSTSVAGFDIGEFYDVDTNDGVFELVIVPKSDNLLDIPGIIAAIKKGERECAGMRMITTKGALIETEKPVRWTLDGEYGGETDTVKFEVKPGAVEFVIRHK